MELQQGDLLAAPGIHPEWQPAETVEEVHGFFLYRTHQKNAVESNQPEGKDQHSDKNYSEENSVTWMKWPFRQVRFAAVFLLLFFASVSAKILIDVFVGRNFYAEASLHPASLETRYKKTGPKYQNALVKKYHAPGDTLVKKFRFPGKPGEIIQQVKVNGQQFPYNDPNPTSLLITIKNESDYLVDVAEVEVNYSEDGKTRTSQTYKVNALAPSGSKTMSVPVIRDGLHISYKVLNIYTRQYSAGLKEI
jgi:hypothetical protein